MDIFKKANVIKATAYDFNAPQVVHIRNRSEMAKKLNRIARRKLKEELNNNKGIKEEY